MMKKILVSIVLLICSFVLIACKGDDTYDLAKKMREYKLTGKGYEETLKMAKTGKYDANCKDCFKGIDSENISLFAYACNVDYDFAKAIYEHGAGIEISNEEFYETPLLAALEGNKNNTDIVYWLIDEGADINAVSFDKCSVFHYLRFWDDNAKTQELISYFKENCDMEYLKDETQGTIFAKWDEMWDENGDFIFYQ